MLSATEQEAEMATDTFTRDIGQQFSVRGFTGELIDPGHPAYEDARHVWSGSIDRRPAAIARCRDTDDVAAAVTATVALGLPLAVRGGGHSMAGHSTCDGGIVVDLSPMRAVTVDPVARRARVAGGALLGDLDRATQEHGLAVPAGQVSHTGVAGLTLGGGVGYLMRAHGLTIDSLRSAEVVTAKGEFVRTSEDEHEDLFWALRGGGGNFGVVTQFDFALHEVGPIINAGVLVFPYERAGEVLRASRELMAEAPDELTIHEILITLPTHEPFPPHLQGTRAAMLVIAHVGSEEQARADVEPLRELGPVFDLLGPMPFTALQTMIDWDTRHGLGHYSKSHWLAGYEDGLIDTLVDRMAQAPSPLSHLITARMGGAIERIPAGATAFAHRSAANLLWVIGLWDDPAEPIDRHRAWVNDIIDSARPYSTGGVYVNAIEDDEGPERVVSAYGQETFARLREVKRRWDPENVFRLNANIPPARLGLV
jgi:FAD/FMN-containing dehydrogenase